MPISSSLPSFLKASSEYVVIFENSRSESKGCYLKQIIHLHMNLAWHVPTQWNPATNVVLKIKLLVFLREFIALEIIAGIYNWKF